VFEKLLRVVAIFAVLLIAFVAFALAFGAKESFEAFGFGFLIGGEWNPVDGIFGAFPFLAGTLITSFAALLISVPFSLAIALLLGEYHQEGRIATLFSSLVELLAGIPSVLYGFFALFYLVPLVRVVEVKLGVPPYGVGVLSASLVLAVMIVPFSASLAREVIRMVPSGLKESAYALGATRFEVLKDVVLPTAKSGIFAGFVLALGRALGETMAVTMVIGNRNELPRSIFDLGNTIASVIANEFAEAGSALHISSLTYLGLALFVSCAAISVVGKAVIRRV
jgi:phosphate transport system permease protein